MPRHSRRVPGYGTGKRGRHKRARSKETLYYEEHVFVPQEAAEKLLEAPEPLPKKPSWMSQDEYEALKRLRAVL